MAEHFSLGVLTPLQSSATSRTIDDLGNGSQEYCEESRYSCCIQCIVVSVVCPPVPTAHLVYLCIAGCTTEPRRRAAQVEQINPVAETEFAEKSVGGPCHSRGSCALEFRLL
jgi:hypothetical protein